MDPNRFEVASYLREIAGKALLAPDEEVFFARELVGARAAVARLAARLPDALRSHLPAEPGNPAAWTFESIRTLQELLARCGSTGVARDRRLFMNISAEAHRFERARRALIEGNLRLVVHVASQNRDRVFGLPDLIQEGNLGLMRAVERFDPERGNRFSTYAYWWIKQAIERAIKEKKRVVRLPSHIEDIQRRAKRISSRLSGKLGRDPRIDELAQEAGLPAEKLDAALRLARQVESVEASTGSADGNAWLENMQDVDRPSPYRSFEVEEIGARVQAMLSRLSPRERRILRLRFGIDCDRNHSLEEIASKLGLSRERVRQIVLKSLKVMRGWAVDPLPRQAAAPPVPR